MSVRLITTRQELTDLARELGVRSDWHEPDERGVSARVEGFTFDNAGLWPTVNVLSGGNPLTTRSVELHVIISRDCQGECGNGSGCCAEDVAAINLADMLAWASGLDD